MESFRYRTRDLIEILIKVGFASTKKSARQKLFRLKLSGKFVPPTVGGNNRWVFNKKHLLEITKNLSPGGSGEWKFDPNNL